MNPDNYTLDGADQEIQDEHADEVCKYCNGYCTSSRECVELAGDDDD